MLIGCRFDGGNSVPALSPVQWHEGGGVSKVWSARHRIPRAEALDFSRDAGIEFCVWRYGKSRNGMRLLVLRVFGVTLG